MHGRRVNAREMRRPSRAGRSWTFGRLHVACRGDGLHAACPGPGARPGWNAARRNSPAPRPARASAQSGTTSGATCRGCTCRQGIA
eukprot:6179699-Prymnesium_polylepis.1